MAKRVVIHPGVQFRSAYADSNALWEVKTARGKGCWNCEIVNEKIVIDGKTYDGDYVGVAKVFGNEEIEASVLSMKACDDGQKEHKAFMESLQPGQIVHYDNGFKSLVRCKVVMLEGIKKCLLPIALVGEWKSWDLPKRTDNGVEELPYYPRMIRSEETFTPNYSCIVESSRYAKGKRGFTAASAAALPEIDLGVPPVSPQMKARHSAQTWAKHVIVEAQKVDDEKDLETFKAFLRSILK